MTKIDLKDFTLSSWWFYSSLGEGFGQESTAQVQDTFKAALSSALQWVGENPGNEQNHKPDFSLPSPGQKSIRLASASRQKANNTEVFLEARAMLDTFYIQLGYLIPGKVSPENTLTIKKEAWAGKGNFYGTASCITVELKQMSAGLLKDSSATDSFKNIIGLIALRWLAQPDMSIEKVEMVELKCGFFGLIPDAEEKVFVLLVWDDHEARRQASHLLHRVFPQLFLTSSQNSAILRQIEQNFSPTINLLKQGLIKELHHVQIQLNEQPLRLKTLEQYCYRIAHLQAKYAENLAQFEASLTTMRLNLFNCEQALEDPLFKENKAKLDDLLASHLRFRIQQITADLNYLTIIQTQADRTLQGIKTMIEVHSARWERALAVLFGLFVVFSIPQAFPEITQMTIKWRLAIHIGFVFGLFVLVWILSRRK